MIERAPILPAVLVAATTLAFVTSPLLAPEFGGFNPDLFPVPQDDPPVQPAGYAFSIWGVIYLWLVVSAGFGLFARARAADWLPMRPALALSVGIGAAWLPVATISAIGATVLIWIMWCTALVALLRAPEHDRFLARGPVALYAGWLTAASCVSLGLLLAGYGVMGPTGAAILALLLALALSIWVLRFLGNFPEFGFSVVWALIAVAVAGWDDATVVTWLAATGAGLVAGVTLSAARRG
ncbi:hypothetical protein [Sedimentitalea todarodis]|uniref:Seryl-tRNA synthetase n=1 Tax=Sedimentitalea todarodis TaxID=1631240 RepID=A0ABU3VBP5_9RHOB|nr:hypothetical protein [Sedimentitalea todarodis]MDU9003597.1 hypothetical protein [Sedimentitalea todarodis]